MASKEVRITLSDGVELLVTPTLEDTLNFETTLRKNKNWGPLQDNVLKMTPFRAWSAARRLGLIDLTWDEFSKGDRAAINVVSVSEDDDTDDDDSLEVDSRLGKDTPTVPSTSSSSSSRSTRAPSRASGLQKRDTTQV